MSLPPANASRADRFEWARSLLSDMKFDLDNGHIKSVRDDAKDIVKILNALLEEQAVF